MHEIHLTLRTKVSPCVKSMLSQAVKSAGEVSVNGNRVPITVCHCCQPIPPCSSDVEYTDNRFPHVSWKPVMRAIICHLPVWRTMQ